MPEDGSPRPRLLRRLSLAIARAVALLILVGGFAGVLALAAPRLGTLPRYVSALLLGVVIFESLRPREKRVVIETPAPAEAAPVLAPPADTSEADAHIARLKSDIEDLVEINDALRQQAERGESSVKQLNDELAKLRAQMATEADAGRAREKKIRDQYEAESEHVQRAAAKAMEEIQRNRASNDEFRTRAEKVGAELATAQQELDALRTERQRSRREIDEVRQQGEVEKAKVAKIEKINTELQTRVTQLQQQLEHIRQQAETDKAALRNSLDAEWKTKVQHIGAGHSTEVADVQARAMQLQQQLEESRRNAQQLLSAGQELTRQLDEERQRFHGELQRVTGDYEGKITELNAALDGAQNDLYALNARVGETRQELDIEKAARRKLDEEWGAKLQKIVNELTSDHENDIGDSIAAREAARAEVRAMTIKIQELQQQLQDARDGRLGLLQRDDQMTHELEGERQARQRLEEEIGALQKLPSASIDEKTLRDKIEAEWSDKLQTIVNHIATDHESDIGKAIEEREAARAEARNLTIKINALQQKLDGERQSRDTVNEKLRAAQDEITALRNAPTLPMPALEVEPKDEQQARAEVLKFAEEAHEALRRITLPSEERKPRILFVHHDPALRSMWRENLGKSGFEVQTAADGLEGLRLAIAEKPDVVIADASMPKMDGHELCQLIKSNQETAGVKVILMTGIYTTEAPKETSAREFEADEMLRKPVKLDAMKSALSTLLAARAAS